MNDEIQCSLEDLNQAAEELIALGCAAGAMQKAPNCMGEGIAAVMSSPILQKVGFMDRASKSQHHADFSG